MDKRVLVVDDHPPTLELMRDALEMSGFSVVTAHNGAEGLMAANSMRPDLVILDVRMPVLDGLQTLHMLREAPDTRCLPVVIVSGRDAFEDVWEGWTHGADLYLTKPVDVRVIVAAVKWLVGVDGRRPESVRRIVESDL